MSDIREKLKQGEISISDAIVKCLPDWRGHVSDEILVWLASELQGYANPLYFYQNGVHNLPPYRVIKGNLKLIGTNGTVTQVEHDLARREQFFLAAPVSWLEEFAKLPGEITLVELPDLTAYLVRGGGNVALECQRQDLTRVLAIIKNRVLEVMDQSPAFHGK